MSARRIVKGNLSIVIWDNLRVYAYSYNTKIMDIIVEEHNGCDKYVDKYFDNRRYSSTTTHHQGYCADIFVRVTTAKDPCAEIAKISADNLHYMSVAERKYWNLV